MIVIYLDIEAYLREVQRVLPSLFFGYVYELFYFIINNNKYFSIFKYCTSDHSTYSIVIIYRCTIGICVAYEAT